MPEEGFMTNRDLILEMRKDISRVEDKVDSLALSVAKDDAGFKSEFGKRPTRAELYTMLGGILGVVGALAAWVKLA